MKNLLLILIFCSLFIGNTFGQNEENRKWLVEIGGSTGQLFSKMTYDDTNIDSTIAYNSIKFQPKLVFRISRKIKTTKTAHSYIKLFIGTSIIGTETEKQQSIFNLTNLGTPTTITESVYYFIPNVELGALLNYPIGNIDIEVGIKGQRHLDLSTNHYYILSRMVTVGNMEQMTREKRIYQLENLFSKYSANAGFRVQYNLNRFLIAAEGWYGITNLSKLELNGINYRQNETNVRLMFGYKF